MLYDIYTQYQKLVTESKAYKSFGKSTLWEVSLILSRTFFASALLCRRRDCNKESKKVIYSKVYHIVYILYYITFLGKDMNALIFGMSGRKYANFWYKNFFTAFRKCFFLQFLHILPLAWDCQIGELERPEICYIFLYYLLVVSWY